MEQCSLDGMPLPVSLLELAEIRKTQQMGTQASQHKPLENLAGDCRQVLDWLYFAIDEHSRPNFSSRDNIKLSYKIGNLSR